MIPKWILFKGRVKHSLIVDTELIQSKEKWVGKGKGLSLDDGVKENMPNGHILPF